MRIVLALVCEFGLAVMFCSSCRVGLMRWVYVLVESRFAGRRYLLLLCLGHGYVVLAIVLLRISRVVSIRVGVVE